MRHAVAVLALLLPLITSCDANAELVASFNQTIEGGKPVIPETGPAYQTGGMQYKALCLYDNERYAHVTHYWSWNTALAREDEVAFGDAVRIGPDSLLFSGKYMNMRGVFAGDSLNIENRTHYFIRSSAVGCPPVKR